MCKTDIYSPSGSTKYSDKDSGGMLVWSPYHAIVDSKRESTSCPSHAAAVLCQVLRPSELCVLPPQWTNTSL